MPPGGKGLTMEMARVGYGSWAVTPETSVASVRMTNAAMRMMGSSPR